MRKETALRRLRKVLLALSISLLYILVFSRPADHELLVSPQWSLDVDDASISPEDGEAIPFRLSGLVGYFTEEGELLFREAVLHDAAVFSDRFVNYSSVSQTAVVRDPHGRVVLSISESGYPLGLGERLFVLHPDGAGLSEWGPEGEALWSRKLPSIITDVAADTGLVAIGLLSGEVLLLDATGQEVAQYRTLGSRIPVVLGVALNEQTGRIAALAGVDPQRLIFLDIRDDQLIPGVQGELPSDFRRPAFVKFLPGGELLAVEGRLGVSLVSPESGRRWMVSGEGMLSGFAAAAEGLVLVATTRDDSQEIRAVLPPERLVFSLDAGSGEVSLDVEGWVCYLGIRDHILAVALERG